jgi:hypothetical protein
VTSNNQTPAGYADRLPPYDASLTCHKCGVVVDYSYTAIQAHNKFHDELTAHNAQPNTQSK